MQEARGDISPRRVIKNGTFCYVIALNDLNVAHALLPTSTLSGVLLKSNIILFENFISKRINEMSVDFVSTLWMAQVMFTPIILSYLADFSDNSNMDFWLFLNI
jgi:hypothetical protein